MEQTVNWIPRMCVLLGKSSFFGCRDLFSRQEVRLVGHRGNFASGVGCPVRVYDQDRCYEALDFYNSSPLRDPAHGPRGCLDRSAGGPTEGAELDLRFKSLVPGYLDIPRI